MHPHISRILISICLTPLLHAQAVTQSNERTNSNLPQKEIARRVFDGERRTIALFAKQQPIVEVYAQSLNAEAMPERIVGDVYFLSRVSLDPDSARHPVTQTFAFGRTAESRQVKMNTGSRWQLYPEGYVDMLFADVTAFDEDHYTLTQEAAEMLENTHCLRMAVTPTEPKWPGQFIGRIWVETANFRIVRLEGTFTAKRPGIFAKYLNPTGISTTSIYFHFDSCRQEVAPGVWMPSYTYFDDELLWNQAKFTTSYHFRGHTWVWGYGENSTAAAGSTGAQGDPISQMQADQLIAAPGAVEHWLDSIVGNMQLAGRAASQDIHCRVLMTTPAELFSSGKTIIISRGLLNLVPNQSILTVLLAREVAHIELGHTQGKVPKIAPVFDARRTSDFHGFGIAYDEAEEAAATRLAVELLGGNQVASAVSQTDAFEAALADQSAQIPRLLHATFGAALVEHRKSARSKRQSVSATESGLVLRADYGIRSSDNTITEPLGFTTTADAAAASSIQLPSGAAQ